MTHADLIAAAAGILITVASVVLGAWLDLRPGGRERKTHRGARRAAGLSAGADRAAVEAARRAGRSEPGGRASAG